MIQLQAGLMLLMLWSGYTTNWWGLAGIGIFLILYIAQMWLQTRRIGISESILDHVIYAPASVIVAVAELGIIWSLYHVYQSL